MSRKHLIGLLAEMNADQFAEHVAEVGRDGQIALLEELFGLQTRPAAINTSSPYWTSEHKHDIAVAMVRAGVAILSHGAAKFRHRDQYDIGHPITHIPDEGGKRNTELSQHVIQLTVFIAVMIPTPDICEGDFHTGIRFDQPRDLL